MDSLTITIPPEIEEAFGRIGYWVVLELPGWDQEGLERREMTLQKVVPGGWHMVCEVRCQRVVDDGEDA